MRLQSPIGRQSQSQPASSLSTQFSPEAVCPVDVFPFGFHAEERQQFCARRVTQLLRAASAQHGSTLWAPSPASSGKTGQSSCVQRVASILSDAPKNYCAAEGSRCWCCRAPSPREQKWFASHALHAREEARSSRSRRIPRWLVFV